MSDHTHRFLTITEENYQKEKQLICYHPCTTEFVKVLVRTQPSVPTLERTSHHRLNLRPFEKKRDANPFSPGRHLPVNPLVPPPPPHRPPHSPAHYFRTTDIPRHALSVPFKLHVFLALTAASQVSCFILLFVTVPALIIHSSPPTPRSEQLNGSPTQDL